MRSRPGGEIGDELPGSPTEFRRADTAEHEKIFRMGFDVWSDGMPLEAYITACHGSRKYARGRWYVLCVDGEPVSSALVHDFPAWGDHVVRGVGSLATRPDKRKQGLAGGLLDELTSFLARAENASVTFLYSDIDSGFYAKRGYVALDARYQRYPEAVMMVSLGAGVPGRILEENAERLPAYF